MPFLLAANRRLTFPEVIDLDAPDEAWKPRTLTLPAPFDEDSVRLGRAQDNDIVLDDEHVAEYHARIYKTGDEYWIEPIAHGNEVTLEGDTIKSPSRLPDKTQILIGEFIVSFERFEWATPEPVVNPVGTVTFVGIGTFDAAADQTIRDVAEVNGVEIRDGCRMGICGADPVKIVSGHANLRPMDDDEQSTVRDVCDLDPTDCRMACMCEVQGHVEVEVIDWDSDAPEPA